MLTLKPSCIALIVLVVIVCVIVKACLGLHIDMSLIVQIVLAIAAIGALFVSIKTLKEQKKSGELQRFESTFFNMMSLQEQITSQLLVEYKINETNPDKSPNKPPYIEKVVEKKGREVFEGLWREMLVYYYETNTMGKRQQNAADGLRGALEQLGIKNYEILQSIVSILDHYFRHMYRIVKFVDGAKCLNDEEKYEYVAILRATLSRYELVWLYYNGLSEVGRKKFKPLMEKYSLLQNLREDYLTTSREVIEDKPLQMLVANNYKGCKYCMDYYAYMTDGEVKNKEYENKGKIPPYNISVFAKKGSDLYGKVLKDYSDYQKAFKVCEEMETHKDTSS